MNIIIEFYIQNSPAIKFQLKLTKFEFLNQVKPKRVSCLKKK